MSPKCDKYIGDKGAGWATSPNLYCVRDRGHGGACDNLYGETPRTYLVKDASCAHCGGVSGVVEIRFGPTEAPNQLVRLCEICRKVLTSQLRDFK